MDDGSGSFTEQLHNVFKYIIQSGFWSHFLQADFLKNGFHFFNQSIVNSHDNVHTYNSSHEQGDEHCFL